ncbi:MAG: tetratricopeptide repeat protein [Candidatus Omnitrophica bacterium]|nr:tetratricopeptide repeat protein [Candidatus Omnitrophota bacterium]
MFFKRSKEKILRLIFTFLITLGFYCLFLGFYACAGQVLSDEEELFLLANKAYKEGAYEIAIGILGEFKRSYPDSSRIPEVNLLIGLCHFYQNRLTMAKNKFEEIINDSKVTGFKDAALFWLGEVYFKNNDFKQASLYYRRVIDEFPDSIYCHDSYYSLGWCMFQNKEFKEALNYFKQLEVFPYKHQEDIAFKIIECMYYLKDYHGLKKRIRDYLSFYPYDKNRIACLYFYLAEADYYTEDFEGSLINYQRVISETQDVNLKGLSYLGMGWSYLKLKRYADAYQTFFQIDLSTLKGPEQESLLLGRAMLCLETGDLRKAEALYDELIRDSSLPEILFQAYLAKAEIYCLLFKYKEAIDIYKEILNKNFFKELKPEAKDNLYYKLGTALLKEHRFKEAIEEFQKIISSSQDKAIKPATLTQLADVYRESGDHLKAIPLYKEILKDYPDIPYQDYILYQLGVSLFAVNDYNESLLMLERLKKEFRDRNLLVQAEYIQGLCLYNLGNFGEAIEVFKDLVRSANHDKGLISKAEFQIAKCYDKLGDEKQAKKRFEELRVKYPDSEFIPEVFWYLGRYHYQANELSKAKRYFSCLIQDFPRSDLVSLGYYGLGLIYEKEASYAEALDLYRKALDSISLEQKPEIQFHIAELLQNQGRIKEAIEEYTRFISSYPENNPLVIKALLRTAGIYEENEDFKKARDIYRKLSLMNIEEAGYARERFEWINRQINLTNQIRR